MQEKIRFYSISKDEFEGGDFVICQECGAHLRHIMEVGNVPYGLDCGAKKAGWTLRKAKKVQDRMKGYIRVFRYFMDKENYKRAYTDGAYPILAVLGLSRQVPYTTDRGVCEIVNELIAE